MQSLPRDFWEQLQSRSDQDLYEMLANEADYLPEAIAAAREELRKRNLTLEQVTQLQAVAQLEQASQKAKADEHLGWPMRILIFFLCAGLLGAVLAVYYESKGYKTKAKEAWITLGVSVLVHIFLGGLARSMR